MVFFRLGETPPATRALTKNLHQIDPPKHDFSAKIVTVTFNEMFKQYVHLRYLW